MGKDSWRRWHLNQILGPHTWLRVPQARQLLGKCSQDPVQTNSTRTSVSHSLTMIFKGSPGDSDEKLG